MVHQFLGREKRSEMVLATFLLNADPQTKNESKGMKENLHHYMQDTEERFLSGTCFEQTKSNTNGSSCNSKLQEDRSWAGMATAILGTDQKERGVKFGNRDSLRSLTNRQKAAKKTSLTSSTDKRRPSLSGSNTSLSSDKSSSSKSDSRETLTQRRTASAPIHVKSASDPVTGIISRQKVGSLDSSPKWSKIKDKFERPEERRQQDEAGKTTVPNGSDASPTGSKVQLGKTSLSSDRRAQETFDKTSKKSSSIPSISGNRQSRVNTFSNWEYKVSSPVLHPVRTLKTTTSQPSLLSNRLQRPLSASASLPNSKIKSSLSIKPASKEKSSTLPTGNEKSIFEDRRNFLRKPESKMNSEGRVMSAVTTRTLRNRLPSLESKEKSKVAGQLSRSKESSSESLFTTNQTSTHFQELKEKLNKRAQLNKTQGSALTLSSSASQAPFSRRKLERNQSDLLPFQSNLLKKTGIITNISSSNAQNKVGSLRTFGSAQDSVMDTSTKAREKWKSNSLGNLLSESGRSNSSLELRAKDKPGSALNSRSVRTSTEVSSKVAELASRFNSLCETSSSDSVSNVQLHRLMKSNTLSDVPSGQENNKAKNFSSSNGFDYNSKPSLSSRSHSVGNIFSKSDSLQTFTPALKDKTDIKSSLKSSQSHASLRNDSPKGNKIESTKGIGILNHDSPGNKSLLDRRLEVQSKLTNAPTSRKDMSEKLKINLEFPADSENSGFLKVKDSGSAKASLDVKNTTDATLSLHSQTSIDTEQGNLVKQVVRSYEKTIASLSPSTARKQIGSHKPSNESVKPLETSKSQAKLKNRSLENKNYSRPYSLQRSLSSSNSLEMSKMNAYNRMIDKMVDSPKSVREIVSRQNSSKCTSRKQTCTESNERVDLYANIPSNTPSSANSPSKVTSDLSPIKKAPVPLPRKCWSVGSSGTDDLDKNHLEGEEGFSHRSSNGNSFIIHKLQPNPSFLWCCNTFGVCGRSGGSFRKSSTVNKPLEENVYDAIQNCSTGTFSPEEAEDHIYMDPLQFHPRDGGISGRLSHASSDNTEEGSCGSDECWVDISDTELDNQKEDFEEINHHQVRMRSLPRRGNQRVNSLRRSWRDSVRDLTCDKTANTETSQADDWKSGEYEDVLTWEIVGAPDHSSAESTDSGHEYEAIYEFVDNNSDNNQYATSAIVSKSGSICSDTSDTGISMDSSGTRSTSAESNSTYAQQNGHCETDSSDIPVMHLQRNKLLTSSDVHLELNAKWDKVKPKKSTHSVSELGIYIQDRTSKASHLKKKTFIKYILRQKSAITYPPAQKNVTSPKKETATFYVPCAFTKEEFKDKCRPLSDPSCVGKYSNGESTIEETVEFEELKISEYQNATVIQRKPRTKKSSNAVAIKRPKTPPPLPPAIASPIAADRSTKSSLSRTKSDGITLAAHRRLLGSDINKRPNSGPAVVYSNCQEMMRQDSTSSDSGKSTRTDGNRDSSCSLFSKEELESILGKDFLSCGTQNSASSRVSQHIYETAGGGGEDMAPLFNGSVSDSPQARGSVASVVSGRSGDSYIHATDVAYIPNWSGGKKCHGFFQEDKVKDVWIEKQQKRSSVTGSEHSYLFFTEHLTSPFEEEPLYQFYQRDAQLRAIQSWTADDYDMVSGEKIYERLYANLMEVEEGSNDDENHVISSKLSAMELVRSDSMGHRTLWCEVPEVINSGILDVLTPEDRRLQEALFEVITSEASYLKSLKILMEHFLQCPQFTSKYSADCVLDQREHHIIFSDVVPVKSVSEKLMADLDKRWKENIVISDLCDILYQHATQNFSVYVKYCSQQVYKDRILKELRETRPEFVEVVRRLETSPVCQGLDMHSFLMLPMQRITRYPLLVDAICSRLPEGSPYHESCKKTLHALNKVVAECNEGARKMHRMEEMLLISRQLDFKDLKSLPLISENRWLVKRGEMIRLLSDNPTKRTFGRLSKPSRVYVYLLLFTDILLVTKKKSENSYQVLDYCQRNMIELIPVEDCADIHGFKNLFQMTMLQNHEGKTVEMILSCPLESDKTRWMEALMPPHPENPGEKVYSSWDFPRVLCVQPYQALQPDELSLDELDIVNVFRKMSDGWYEGERVRDLAKGWFPASHTTEIIDDHVKSRNFKQRHAFLKLVAEQTKIASAT